jgi:hypothetical protein
MTKVKYQRDGCGTNRRHSRGHRAQVPGRGWWVWFRIYGPTEPFFDRSWQLPDFEKMN